MKRKEFRPSGAIYKIDRMAGNGGSSSVFKALREDREGHSRQTVALKILKDKNAVSWLRKEFETLSQIRSIHCAQILAWENLEVGPALVLEWIDGITLLDFAKTRSCDTKVLSEIAAQVQAGLKELDQLGFHHGDLSPGNILIDRSGTVRLVDFATMNTEFGGVAGTPAYIAPELWSGQPASIHSDLFALGLLVEDLSTRFEFVPTSIEQCRVRAIAAQTESSGWMCSDPSRRKFLEIDSNFEIKRKLALSVSEQLDQQVSMSLRTRVFSEDRKSWPLLRRVVALVGVTLISSIMSVRAQAPIPSTASEQQASLKVASHHWIHLQLNGKNVGYAPIELKTLRPGRHRLIWKTARGKGEVLLNLAPGERIMLSEAQLSRL